MEALAAPRRAMAAFQQKNASLQEQLKKAKQYVQSMASNCADLQDRNAKLQAQVKAALEGRRQS